MSDVYEVLGQSITGQGRSRRCWPEYIGWIFTPLKLEKVLFLYGSGKNGKSVFVDIVEALLGKENISHESLSDMCGENGDRSRA